MMLNNRQRITTFAVFCIALFLSSAQADFYQNRIYKIREKISLDQNWKFINDLTTGTPQATNYNDASWATVNIPHSAKYAAPTNNAERATMPRVGNWTGISWYRKSFTLPSNGPTKKVFLEFEGAMSTAEVYLNGNLIGSHMNSGFTGFSFDISTVVNRTGQNVLAVKLNCNYMADVPPGKLDTTGNEYPDYQLFSGLYRDVWLVCTDNVYIPLYGQQISTPQISGSSGTVRVRTTVVNDSAASRNCSVRFVIVDDKDNVISDKTSTATIAANGSKRFDVTTETLSGIRLWSPETPNLYRVFTKVIVDNNEVDDNVERFGFRKLDWKSNGFYLNDARYELKGVNMHNEFAWVGHALPNSRYFEEVKLVKDMGANAIRCAHYPRDPSFYNACDELGVICEPELPSWGGQTTAYPAVFWDRMNACAQEMVQVGYNHPSIILWGIFNEPPISDYFITQFKRLNSTIKALDSTRFTSNINNKWYPPGSDAQNGVTDVHGLNYSLPTASTIKVYNSEYAQGWNRYCLRGAASTSGNYYSEDEYSSIRWSGSNGDLGWTQIAANISIAGGHMWVFVDYWSANSGLSYPMGVLDHYRIPKKVYYTFKKNWTGKDDDYPVNGLTATSVKLEADVTTLTADSTDLSRIIASIRDASGKCVWADQNVTFTVSGPVDVFDDISKPIQTIAGKIGIIVKSKNTTGPITISASSGTLTPATLTLNAVAPDVSSLPFIWPATSIRTQKLASGLESKKISVTQRGRTLLIAGGSFDLPGSKISLINCAGKTISYPANGRGMITINSASLPSGVYTLLIRTSGASITKKVLLN